MFLKTALEVFNALAVAI